MNKISIGIFGPSGRMGRDIIKNLENKKEFVLANLCEKEGHKSVGQKLNGIQIESDIPTLISSVDVIIDFSIPEATIKLIKQMKKTKTKTALITGTTGYSKAQEKKFLELSKGLKVLRSFNMSIGVNLVRGLTKIASRQISHKSDIEIFESHHNNKIDLPSGTAKSLGDSVNEGAGKNKKFAFREKTVNRVRKKNEIGFSAIRGGDVVGDHTVFFFLDGERIEISHKAHSRKIFSLGAISAAKWIIKKNPGLYSISDMLD